MIRTGESREQMAIAGGFLALTALIELALSGLVLAVGAGGWLHLLLLLLWLSVTAWIGWRYYRRRCEWTEARLTMTNDLVEGMMGHRTRLAQEARAQWNEGEDETLDRYYDVSRALDREARGWLTRVVGANALVALEPWRTTPPRHSCSFARSR